MAFGFFKDKNKGPIEVTCPLCQHCQQESRLAVSSYCKGCKAYLSFEKDGEIKARAQAPPDPFAHRPAQPKVEIEYKAREEPAPLPRKAPLPLPAETKPPTASAQTPPKPPEADAATPAPIVDKVHEDQDVEVIDQIETSSQEKSLPEFPEFSPLAKTESPSPSTEDSPARYHAADDESEHLHDSKAKTREVACFECGDTHPANIRANSTQCRNCGRLISLENREVREPLSSRIQTRGDVHIFKKGIVHGESIQCHNLIVEGDFTGDAECSGDLTLRRSGKIAGKITCKHLRVEKRAKIEFLNSVVMEECRIDGLVTGHLACRGLLALEKKATLTGNIKVGRLTVAEGAKHTGQIQMGGF